MGEVKLKDGRLMDEAEYHHRLQLLTKPFDPSHIEKLPKPLMAKDQDRGYCNRGSKYSADGYFCGGKHPRAIHLDYVGHAGITERLNEVDPEWTWEPLAYNDNGTPLIIDGGMWGKLTVLGVTRLGFGDAGGKDFSTSAVKEIIGDFLRNAAMRFGVATYLWSKSDAAFQKRQGEEAGGEPTAQQPPEAPQQPHQPPKSPQEVFNESLARARGNPTTLAALRKWAEQNRFPDEAMAAIAQAEDELQGAQGGR